MVSHGPFGSMALIVTTHRQAGKMGLTNVQIAKRLFLTESTVKQHLRAVYKALGVSNRTEAIRLLRSGD